MLLRLDITFRVPEGIEDANEGRSLAGEVVYVEQLKAAKAGRPQGGFNFLFI